MIFGIISDWCRICSVRPRGLMVKALVFGKAHQRFVRSNRTEVVLLFGLSPLTTYSSVYLSTH